MGKGDGRRGGGGNQALPHVTGQQETLRRPGAHKQSGGQNDKIKKANKGKNKTANELNATYTKQVRHNDTNKKK